MVPNDQREIWNKISDNCGLPKYQSTLIVMVVLLERLLYVCKVRVLHCSWYASTATMHVSALQPFEPFSQPTVNNKDNLQQRKLVPYIGP